MRLLNITNAKTPKGEAKGYLTGILYLAPYNLSGKNLCPKSTEGCRKSCLYSAGRGAFNSVQEARIKKSKWFLNDRYGFILQLIKDIQSLEWKAKREGLIPVVRLNGTSDIRWEIVAPAIFKEFSHIQFYDYTKYQLASRIHNMPANYKLTYSAAETATPKEFANNLLLGNIAVVVESIEMKFKMLQDSKLFAIDGDETDLRFLDPSHNHLVLLTAKGRAKKDTSGFVVR